MSDAPWSGSHAAYPQESYPYQQHRQHRPAPGHYGSPYVHPAHGGPAPEPRFHDQPAQPGPEGGDGGAPEGVGSAFGRALHGVGALLSLALIAGLAVWGYQLAMRDVTGVPVVRALEGPMRIQPEEPGGVAAAHQGLAVNTVAAEGQAEGPADQVALAPGPLALAEEDAPARVGAAAAEVSALREAERDDAPEPDLAAENVSLSPTEAMDETDTDDATAAALAMAEAASAGAAPLSGEETDLAIEPEAEARLAAATIPASVPGVSRSPRPAPRPNEIVARAAASPVEIALASASAAAGRSVREVDAGAVPVGTPLVQLGAYESAEVARGEWRRIAGRFPDFLDGKDRVIEKAQSGGKTFYRLRAMGFEEVADTRHFCAALSAGQAECIPVVTR
ncbi:SPOR domain-containing protein [Sinisalibacter lacisalsi]|uniref:Sporulation protein n=1 Tax=Sinisalibacter lacisalsi TaxID=1526570 RepID=A0ABQ1QKV2_9RHOB|nr:SPOR domain-containing protein [Sinisalibacter lacisalsi]GGD29586.1 sporulation protein [Sinisalibacter lacisalsi]